ncbi:MAG: dihydroorotate dehydrogenase [Thermogutta sp.]
MAERARECDLSVNIGGLNLPNPVMFASGTFGNIIDGYPFHSLAQLGAIVPKTVTLHPRIGNPAPRTVETPSGVLNSIGLDNDGLTAFIRNRLPSLAGVGPPVIVSIAAKNEGEFIEMAEILETTPGVAAIELNLSCPNVAGGIDFATDPRRCQNLVQRVRERFRRPILAKLTPNTGDVVSVARAAADAGADGITAVNTLLGLAVDWRKQQPRLGGFFGGLSGPAIKPVALRVVYQIARAVDIPIVAAGGVVTVDDAMDFFVAGASAVQVGTASFFRPTAAWEIIDGLPAALQELGACSLREVIKTLHEAERKNESEEVS